MGENLSQSKSVDTAHVSLSGLTGKAMTCPDCGWFVAKFKTASRWEFDLRCWACGKRIGTELWAHKDPPPLFVNADEWPPERVFVSDSDSQTVKENRRKDL